MPGAHIIQFADADDWVPPITETVQIQKKQTASLEATYVVINTSAVVISEFMTSNETTIATVVGGQTIFPDWIEIYNPTRRDDGPGRMVLDRRSR